MIHVVDKMKCKLAVFWDEIYEVFFHRIRSLDLYIVCQFFFTDRCYSTIAAAIVRMKIYRKHLNFILPIFGDVALINSIGPKFLKESSFHVCFLI